MRSHTLFQKTFASFLAFLFTFVMVSNSFSGSAYAQSAPFQPLPSEAQLRDEILMGGQAIELLAQRLLQENERPSPPAEPELPGVFKGRHCTQCHSVPSSPPPLDIPLSPQQRTSHWYLLPPEEKFNILHQEMLTLKLKVTQYLELPQTPLDLQVTFIKGYLNALSQYLITSLTMHPLSNPFDDLEEVWALPLSLESIDRMKAHISKTETFKTTKEIFTTLIYFKEGRMSFSDTFKIAIELSSFLHQKNEDAWLNILKLQTVQYLGRQLLHINAYWPQTHSKNKEFFGSLSQHFRSLNHSFGSTLQDQERQRQTNFNRFLGDHLSTQDIPTLITQERYQDLMSHAPRLWDAIGNRFEEYFKESSWIKMEKENTSTEIKKTFYLHPFSIENYDPRELARWTKMKLIEIKKKFLHDHLEYHFLKRKEITSEEATSLEEKYVAEFEITLTPERIAEWFTTFDSSTPAAVNSAFEFLKLSAQVEGAEEQIAQIDEQIQALLLYDFNKHASWGRTVFQTRQIDQSWVDSGMEKEEMNGMVPGPDSSIPDILPIEKFPKINPIEMNPTNFSIVVAMLISSIKNNLFLVKHIEEFTKAQTKKELIQNYNSLVEEVSLMHTFSSFPIHEREKLKETLMALEKLGEKIKRLNPKNTETLDDFFTTSKEKVEFLKTKRAIFTNILHILAVPIETMTPEKTYLYHLQDLKKQEGVTQEEVETFLITGEKTIEKLYRDTFEKYSFPMPILFRYSDYSVKEFLEEYHKKEQEFLKDLSPAQRDHATSQNREILSQLRQLEHHLQYFHAGYVHPEYFIEAKGNLHPRTLERLKRVQELRKERKEVYLDKGGADLDTWLKGYIGTLMLRHALIAQDLLIRKSIDKVVHAKTMDEIKEFVLDPFILNQALELVQKEYPTQAWRVENYRKVHADLIHEISESPFDAYFGNSWHSAAFWSLVTLQIILYFIPGTQLVAVAIGVLLLTDAIVQTGHELHKNFIELPRSLQNKKDFFLSSAIPEEIMIAGEGPGGEYQDFSKMEEDIFWSQVITGSVSVLLLPWARFEIKRVLKLLHPPPPSLSH